MQEKRCFLCFSTETINRKRHQLTATRMLLRYQLISPSIQLQNQTPFSKGTYRKLVTRHDDTAANERR